MIIKDFDKITKENSNFRKVLSTNIHSQLVVMSIPIGDEIGEEVHTSSDQIFIIVEGDAEMITSDQSQRFGDEDIVIIPAGTKHNIKNVGDEELKLLTIYAPAHHPDGVIHATKEDAQNA